MSPEQAMGECTIDARGDIYALGAVTYEMLTGEPPFSGAIVQAIVARVLTEKPQSMITVRDTVPRPVERAVLMALAKLPADRFATTGEFALALAERDDGSGGAGTPAAAMQTAHAPIARRWRSAALVTTSVLVATGVLAAAEWLRRTPPGPGVAFTIDVPEYAVVSGSLALAPDGSRFTDADDDGRLLVRELADLAPKPLTGIALGWGAVFSPDGQSAALVTGSPGALAVVPIRGGSPRVLVPDSAYGTGVAWQGDWIYYLRGPAFGRDLMRIPSGGGTPEFLARADTAVNALLYVWPQMLPGGTKMLLTVHPITGNPSVGVLDLASAKVTLLAAGGFGRYAPTGHLLLLQDDKTLQAARFDAAANPTPFTLSTNGTLLYSKATAPGQVVRVSRTDGREEPVDAEWRGDVGPPALLPDGTQLALSANRPDDLGKPKHGRREGGGELAAAAGDEAGRERAALSTAPLRCQRVGVVRHAACILARTVSRTSAPVLPRKAIKVSTLKRSILPRRRSLTRGGETPGIPAHSAGVSPSVARRGACAAG